MNTNVQYYVHFTQVHVSWYWNCSIHFQLQWTIEDKDIWTSCSTGIKLKAYAFIIRIPYRKWCRNENNSKIDKTTNQIFLVENIGKAIEEEGRLLILYNSLKNSIVIMGR
jgi:hypothetical protein